MIIFISMKRTFSFTIFPFYVLKFAFQAFMIKNLKLIICEGVEYSSRSSHYLPLEINEQKYRDKTLKR